MKKLLALAMLSTVFLAEPCFGADFNQGKISLSFSGAVFKDENSFTIIPPIVPAIGYHCTDSIKISVEPVIFFSNVINYGTSSYALDQLQYQERSLQAQEQVQSSFVLVMQEQPEFAAKQVQELERRKQQLQSEKTSLEQQLSDASSKDMWGVLVNLHYHYKFTKTDITPYISAGIGTNVSGKMEYYFSYKIDFGVNLPLSSRTNIFTGYRLLGVREDYTHGMEFGMNFNL